MIRRNTWLTFSCLAAVCGPLGAQQSVPAEQELLEEQQPAPELTRVAVLSYGSFAATEETGGLSAEAFRSQMKYLQEQGVTPLSLQQFMDWHQGRLALAGPAVLITLDEADISAYTVAFPVLRELGFPFVIFADGRHFQDSPDMLNENQLREMQLAGAAIGSAGLNRLQSSAWQQAGLAGEESVLKTAERELGLSAHRITSAFGSCDVFAYPGGTISADIVSNLPVYGYKLAFGQRGGRVQPGAPAYMLNRYVIQDMPSLIRAVESPDTADDVASLPVALAAAAPEARPISTERAAGRLVRPVPGADWVTESFSRPLVPREQTRVAVLGYHNFSNSRAVSDMCMRTSEFCQQMQYIQDAGLTVITMQDFLEWRLGERCLPERCVLITIDDGWRSVYTDAYPVLKAYGYPFTLFLYSTYLSGKGQSMTPEMVREMVEYGATVGSHSTTHLYPSQWKCLEEGSEAYAAQLQAELPDSVEKMKQLFGNCSTYCYPGGYHTPPMLEALRGCGVQAAFTVLERKVTTEEEPLLVHRYMVFGNDPRIFRRAVNFDDVAGIRPTAQGITEARARARAVHPAAFEVTPVGSASLPGAFPATGPIPGPQPVPAPRAVLEKLPEPIYSEPSA